MSPLRVLVIAEDPLARAGLAVALSSEPEVEVIGRLGPSGEVASEAHAFSPDVVLFDLGWEGAPGGAGPEAVADLIESGLRLVVLVSSEAQARHAWLAGAGAILSREALTPLLVAALRAAHAGLIVVDPALSGVLPSRSREAEPLVEDLTPREMEVLTLVADGLTNRAIAQRLGISENTVKFHLNALLGKLGAQSRTEAVVRATRLGLIAL